MLTCLNIRNLAIVEQLTVHFKSGFHVITGETGAGKSILLNAIALLLGQKTDTRLIHIEAEFCEISADFQLTEMHPLQQWLRQHNRHRSAATCTLTRRISRHSRSTFTLNETPCPLTTIKHFAPSLVTLHNQHQHYTLTQTTQQRQLLDQFAHNTALSDAVKQHFTHWQQCQKDIQQAEQICKQRHERMELIRYQLDELEDLSPQPDELEPLYQTQKQQQNSQACLEQTALALDTLLDHPQHNTNTLLCQAQQALAPYRDLYPVLSNACQLLDEAATLIQESTHDIRHFCQEIHPDTSRLNEVETRLTTYHDIARKHHATPNALWQIQQDLQTELNDLVHATVLLESLKAQEIEHLAHYHQAAHRLTQVREEASTRLAEQVTQRIQTLGMQQGQFIITLTPHPQPTLQGNETIVFHLSTNPGHPPQPLCAVASGGELSRLSLVLHTLCHASTLPNTWILDEIDTGISGRVAEKVGQLLVELAQHHQLLCITHLPQVAAQATHHYVVTKEISPNNTETTITALTDQQKIDALAALLGGSNLSQQTLANAQCLYDSHHT